MRVVVWSTGGVGKVAIDAVSRRPDLELVGVWVHSADKVGRDVGELAGGAPLGVAATDDAEALIACKPDCVVYAASGPERDGDIDGDPDVHCEMTMGAAQGHGAGHAAMASTAMRVVNAIPYVVTAPAGLLSSLDIPMTLPLYAFD